MIPINEHCDQLIGSVVQFYRSGGYWCRDVERALFLAYCLGYKSTGYAVSDEIYSRLMPFDPQVRLFLEAMKQVVHDTDNHTDVRSVQSEGRVGKHPGLILGLSRLLVHTRKVASRRAAADMRAFDARFVSRSEPVFIEGVV